MSRSTLIPHSGSVKFLNYQGHHIPHLSNFDAISFLRLINKIRREIWPTKGSLLWTSGKAFVAGTTDNLSATLLTPWNMIARRCEKYIEYARAQGLSPGDVQTMRQQFRKLLALHSRSGHRSGQSPYSHLRATAI